MNEIKKLKEFRDLSNLGRPKYSLLFGSVNTFIMYTGLGLASELFLSLNNYFSLDGFNALVYAF